MKNKYVENEHISLFLFFSVAVIYAVIYMTKNCYSAAMVLLVEENFLTKTQTGTISAMFYLVYAVFQVIGGIAADRFSPHKLIAIGLVGAMISNAAISVATNYYAMMGIWTFNAAIQFGVWPAIFKIVSTMLAPAHRHNAIFYITFSSTIGSVLSYLIAGMVNGWRANFVVSAISLLVCSVFWIVAGKFFDKNMVSEEPIGHGVAHLPEKMVHDNNSEISIAKLLLTSGIIIMLPAISLKSIFSVGMQSVIPSMLKESYTTVSPSVASILNIFPILIGILGKYVMQFIYSKKRHNEAMTMALCMLVMMIPLFVMSFVGKISVWCIVVMVSAVLLISNAAGVVSTTYLPVRFNKMGKTATVSGIVNAMASLGIVMSNFVSPRLADMFGGWVEVTYAWLAFAAASVLIFLISYLPWRKFVTKQND